MFIAITFIQGSKQHLTGKERNFNSHDALCSQQQLEEEVAADWT